MALSSLLFFWRCVAVVVVRSLVVSGATGVVEVDASNWDERVGSSAHAVVEFYAPWCSHCSLFEGEFLKAASEAPGVVFGRVDGTREPLLARGVTGYPEIYFYRFGERFSNAYEGPREAEPLRKWVEAKARPMVMVLQNWTEARAFWGSSSENTVVRVLGVATNENYRNEWFAALEEAARALETENVHFALTVNPALADLSLDAEPGLYLRSPFDDDDDDDDEQSLKSDKPPPLEKILRFVEARSSPAVMVYTATTSQQNILGSSLVHVLLVLDLEKDEYLDAAFEIAAKARREQARHLLVSASDQRLLEHFDIDITELPALLAVDLRNNDDDDGEGKNARIYRYEPRLFQDVDFSSSSPALVSKAMLAFVDAVLAKDLRPYLRSEDPTLVGTPPELFRKTSAEGKVLHLTGRSFETIVSESRRDPRDSTDFFVSFAVVRSL